MSRIWHKANFLSKELLFWILELSFSKTSCLTKAKEHSLSYYLLITVGEGRDSYLSQEQ